MRVDFGDGGGLEVFKRRMNALGENFWEELTRVLNLGGRFRTPDAFDAPYVYSDDYRALFEFKEGRWWLVAFVAGD